MSPGTAVLAPGSKVLYDGELAEIISFDGRSVTLHCGRSGHFRAVQLSRLVAAARPAAAPRAVGGDGPAPDLTMPSLTPEQRERLAERAGHVREVLSGYRSGFADAALPGEPRPQYAPGRPAGTRYQAKAAELGVTARTVERWVASYLDHGEPGLADTRLLKSRGSRVDPRWEDAVRQVMADAVNEPTLTQDALLFRADRKLDGAYGEGTVPRPPNPTAYRRLTELAAGTYAFSGAAKLRRSKASGPSGVYGRLRPCRPGEYVILDTNSLDVFAMEPVTCRWVSAQLTVAQDLYHHGICGLRVTPVSTKAVDVAAVLYQTIVPQAAPDDWPEEACWPYVGVPQNLVFGEAGRLQGIPPCPPETIIASRTPGRCRA